MFSTPSALRWLLRYGSYLAILAAVGILLTSAWVWSDAGTHPVLRRILSTSLIVTAVLAFAQVLVVASDVSGKAPWASFGSIDAATTTDAGMAFMIRIVLALAMWIVLFRVRARQLRRLLDRGLASRRSVCSRRGRSPVTLVRCDGQQSA